MIEQQQEHVIRQIASSSEYSAHVLRATSQPRQRNPQQFNIFDTHDDDACHATQDDFDRLNEESLRTHLSRIESASESLNA